MFTIKQGKVYKEMKKYMVKMVSQSKLKVQKIILLVE